MAENTTATPEVSVTEQAIQKLNTMLGVKPDKNKKTIIEHLKERVNVSEALAKDILREGRDWPNCWNYIYKQAAKAPRQSSCAMVDDDVVFEWAEDYFHAEEEKKPATAAKEEKKPASKPAKKEAEKPEKKEEKKPTTAKKTLYYKTNDTYWRVEKGSPMPTEDSLKEAEEITKDEYERGIGAVTKKPEKKPKEKPKNEMDGQMNLFDMFGG